MSKGLNLDNFELIRALMGQAATDSYDQAGLSGILGLALPARQHPLPVKNFTQRYLYPSQFPSIDNGDGSISTHRMASGEVDGKFIAFPTIVQIAGGQLLQLDDDAAFQYAMRTGEYMQFPTDAEARAFAEGGYKRMSKQKGLLGL